jgi:hypothetical protein
VASFLFNQTTIRYKKRAIELMTLFNLRFTAVKQVVKAAFLPLQLHSLDEGVCGERYYNAEAGSFTETL